MYGSETDVGIIPNSIDLLVENFQNGEIHCSFFEIYNEIVVDLLKKDNPTKILNGRVTNLVEHHIQSADQFNKILAIANGNRTIAATQRNQGSSRSHGVVQVRLNGSQNNKPFESYFILLDLAGVENANDHLDEIEKSKRAVEMSNINKSVSALRTVVETLTKGSGFPDFRSSKLTHVLKPCLSTNFKTMFIATVSQQYKYFATSKDTLSLAKAAIKIKFKNND